MGSFASQKWYSPYLVVCIPSGGLLGDQDSVFKGHVFFQCILAMFVQYYTNTLRVFVTFHIHGYEQFTKFRRAVCVRNYIKAPSYQFLNILHCWFNWVGLVPLSRVTHICVSKLSIIDSDSGLSPGQRQTIIWTNAGILLIWTLGTNFSENLITIHTFSFKKMQLKMSSGK